MSVPEELMIPVGSLQVAARAWGPPDGVPVLGLHGWLDNAATFDRVAPSLLGLGLRLVCVDLPGHGRSDHVGPGQLYAFIDWIPQVLAIADALGWDRFGLLGHSMGAAIASVLAGTVPSRVTRMVLIEGLGPLAEPPERAAERLATSIKEQHEREDRPLPVYASMEEGAERLRKAMGTMTERGAQILAERGLHRVEGGFTWRSDPRLRVPSRMRLSEDQVMAFLHAIEAPTLVVRGSEGTPFAPTAASSRLAAVREATLVELPGGHHLHLDHPEPVAAAIAEFFAPLFPAD